MRFQNRGNKEKILGFQKGNKQTKTFYIKRIGIALDSTHQKLEGDGAVPSIFFRKINPDLEFYIQPNYTSKMRVK